MDSQKWELVKRLFEGAVDLAAEERKAYLDRNGPPDASVRQEVESLLESHDQPQQAFDKPVWEAARVPDTLLPEPVEVGV